MKKSTEGQNKPAVLQWIVPFAIPMVVVLLILFNFSMKSKVNAQKRISEDMLASAQRYAEIVANELDTMSSVVRSVCAVLEQDQTLSDTQTAELVKITAKSTSAARAEFCDGTGEGIDQAGNRISIGQEQYFQKIAASDGSLFFVGADEQMEQESMVVVERLDSGRFMLLFYPVERFDGLLTDKDQAAGAFLALIDEKGRVLSESGTGSGLFDGGNLLDAVRTDDPKAAESIEGYVAMEIQGTCSVQAMGERRVLTYAPLGRNRWGIVLGIEQDYADGLISAQWKNTRSMLIALIVITVVFSCIVMVVDIFGRIRDNQQKKELENKADTDLLTGLNNKLATERKIKNYMEQNPQTQSMMFLLDVDNFKTVNDTMGHAFGDEVLSTLGEEISAIFRASDIIGRVGGDEFMIFLKGVPTPEVVRKEAKKVEDFFKTFQVGKNVKYAVRASIGVAVFPKEGADFETLYKAADQGLYKAKRRGKNQLAFYEDAWAQDDGM